MARVFAGIEITEEFVDDLVDEWYDNEETMPSSLEAFICMNTGWTNEEYVNWVRTGEVV